MARRFEYNDSSSNKFWEIAVEGASHTVSYGKIGANPQTKTKEFDSGEAAEKDASKLVAQKTKKGYVEVDADSREGTVEGNDLGKNDLGTKLRSILGGLCKTDDDEEIMKRLCAAVRSIDESTMNFDDGDGYDWDVEYKPGAKVVYAEGIPRSFCEIAATVMSLTWDGGGPEVGFEISDEGQPVADAWLFDEVAEEEDFAEDAARIQEAGEVVASFLAGQNGLFFDPTRTLANGEWAMAFIDHEGGGWEEVGSVDDLDYGQILLRLLSDRATGSNFVPEVSF